ncbi:MAG: metallophosphoesterase family protein [Rhodothermales bacterium]
MTIAHLSDVHFGRIAYPEIVDVLVGEVNARGVDLVVISGDLTQRARRKQFRAAVAMLQSFEAPTLVVPGNHDVYAWWHRPFLRVFHPVRRYRQYVTDNLRPTFEQDGVAVLGINSAHGLTIKGGRIRAPERACIETFFPGTGDGVFNVLVVHHHLTWIEAVGKHDVARQGRETFDAALRAGVDLVLCGHLHVSHVEPFQAPSGRRIVIAAAGTATSNRSRESQSRANYYNVIEVGPASFSIEERRYAPEAQRFKPERRTRFER